VIQRQGARKYATVSLLRTSSTISIAIGRMFTMAAFSCDWFSLLKTKNSHHLVIALQELATSNEHF